MYGRVFRIGIRVLVLGFFRGILYGSVVNLFLGGLGLGRFMGRINRAIKVFRGFVI